MSKRQIEFKHLQLLATTVKTFISSILDSIIGAIDEVDANKVDKTQIMEGAGVNTDGVSGLVPTPIRGQQKKFLRGDGTWEDVNRLNGGSYLGQFKISDNGNDIIDPSESYKITTTGSNLKIEPIGSGYGIEVGIDGIHFTTSVGDKMNIMKTANGGSLGIVAPNPFRIQMRSTPNLLGAYFTFTNYSFYACPDNMGGTTNLGQIDYKWTSVYTSNGVIQTSDRQSKTNIRKVVSAASLLADQGLPSPSIDGKEDYEYSDITIDSVVNFIKSIDPVTFTYTKGKSKNPDDHPAATQLGLIADDIIDTEIFKYIGVEEDSKTSESGKSLGLQPLPMAVLALTCCKYLINKVEELQKTIESRE